MSDRDSAALENDQSVKRARIEENDSVDNIQEAATTVAEEPAATPTTESTPTSQEQQQTAMFRLRVSNLPKYTTGNALKKFAANSLGLTEIRINKAPAWTYAMVSVKKNKLQAEVVNDEDRERFYERKREARRAEAETDTRTPDQRLADQVTPMHAIEYSKQLLNKWRTSKNTMVDFQKEMRKISATAKTPLAWVDNTGAEAFAIEEITPSPVQEGYRSKCEFTIGTNPSDEPTVGFLLGGYKDGQVAVLNATNCKHVHPAAKILANYMEKCVREAEYPVYNRVTKQGVWRNLLIKTQDTGENMVVVQYNPTDLSVEQIDQLKQLVSKTFLEQNEVPITTLMVQAWGEMFNGFTDKAPFEQLKGDGIIHEELLNCRFRLSATSFFQVNTKATEKLYSIVQEWCSLGDPQTILLDLCSGTGTIGITMASKVQQVIGVELCEEAVEAARLNVELNGCTNVTYHCGKVEDHIDRVLSQLPSNAPVVAVLDPPPCDAKQASKNFIDLCRPTSNRYCGKPFRPLRAKPVDLFPHTKHCEMVVEFVRDDSAEVAMPVE
ncbi:S-adenosyl-L-methionine-dependent methyltransferase [Syncephalis fuscata]|nr:S-adenosyl-L-methionine-dependent methyltransferase [Syncephalis fuscata]